MFGRFCSIGSLAKDLEEAGVQNVTVKKALFSRTQNGVRIKAWGRPSNGFVKNILFQHIVMDNVQNPIVIDQNYCPSHKGCPGQVIYMICKQFKWTFNLWLSIIFRLLTLL